MDLAADPPRHPDKSLRYQAVAEHPETFLAHRAERERLVPGFVERKFRAYPECGILAHGFLGVHCNACDGPSGCYSRPGDQTVRFADTAAFDRRVS